MFSADIQRVFLNNLCPLKTSHSIHNEVPCTYNMSTNRRAVSERLTCAGIPSLNEAPDDSATLVTGLFHALALFLREAMLQKDSQIRLILLRVLSGDKEQKSIYHNSN